MRDGCSNNFGTRQAHKQTKQDNGIRWTLNKQQPHIVNTNMMVNMLLNSAIICCFSMSDVWGSRSIGDQHAIPYIGINTDDIDEAKTKVHPSNLEDKKLRPIDFANAQ